MEVSAFLLQKCNWVAEIKGRGATPGLKLRRDGQAKGVESISRDKNTDLKPEEQVPVDFATSGSCRMTTI